MEGKTDGWTGEPIMQPPRGRPHNKSSAFFVTVRAGTAYRHLFCQRYVFFSFFNVYGPHYSCTPRCALNHKLFIVLNAW